MKKTLYAGIISGAMVAAGAAFAMSHGTIAEKAMETEDLSTLVTAVQAAGLVETLQGEGPFTVFAPTNAAFDALPEGTLDAVLADTDQLTSILTYHVVSGEVMSGDLTAEIQNSEGGFEITTVEGGTLTATIDGGNVILTDAGGNAATVVAADVDASNGVVHVIDSVLMP